MTLINSKEIVSQKLDAIFPDAQFYLHASPIFLLLLGGIVALFVGLMRNKDPEKPNMTAIGIALVSLLTALVPPIITFNANPKSYLASGFLTDGLTKFGFFVIVAGTLFTVLAALVTTVGRALLRPELLFTLLFSSAGMMIMVSSGEFLSFFVGLELMSIALYVLVGYQRRNSFSLEAVLKYFILGATAAGMLLMGMALLYANTGSLTWESLGQLDFQNGNLVAKIGIVLLFSGIAFKLGLFPFHAWAPDVYQASHSVLTGYMASLVKLSIVVVAIRILGSLSGGSPDILRTFFWVVGAASIVWGSCFGLVHSSIKRMLAYSSVANAGYFCLAFLSLADDPFNVTAREALVAYTAIYAILNMSVFFVLSWLEEGHREDLLKDELAGLGKRSPFVAVALTIFVFGLAGIPPLAGFFGKFMLISSSVSSGFVGLPILMVLMSCLSLYYYLSLLVEVWFKEPTRYSVNPTEVVREKFELNLNQMLLTFGVIVSLLIGVFGPRWMTFINFVPGSAATEPSITKK
jgi:proton-translocating NADH-quinone oxidoreductase chain N